MVDGGAACAGRCSGGRVGAAVNNVSRPDKVERQHGNAVENAFAKLKALLRKAAERTIDGLWRATGKLLGPFTPAECRNYFVHAGYGAR